MQILDIGDVLKDFDRLVDEAADGNAFVVSVYGVPRFKVLPLEEEDLERLIESEE
jgi:hypothetical protein